MNIAARRDQQHPMSPFPIRCKIKLWMPPILWDWLSTQQAPRNVPPTTNWSQETLFMSSTRSWEPVLAWS